jgi:hypothetical protein
MDEAQRGAETLQSTDEVCGRLNAKSSAYWRGLEERSACIACGVSRFSLVGVHWDDGDDWHHWWKEQFDNYQAIPHSLNNVLEVGCGPYTNLRVILEDRQRNMFIVVTLWPSTTSH